MPRPSPNPNNPIRLLRCAANLTQAQLAVKLAIPANTLLKLENGHLDPTVEIRQKLMLLFWVDPDSLLAKTGLPTPLPLDEHERSLEEHIQTWKRVREKLNLDSRAYFRRHILRKLDVLFEAAKRKGIGLDVGLLIESWIDETVLRTGLTKLVEEIRCERSQSGKPVEWEKQVQFEASEDQKSILVRLSSDHPGWLKDEMAETIEILKRQKQAQGPKKASPKPV